MRFATLASEHHVRRQSHVAGGFLPHEMEGVVSEPHAAATVGHGVSALRRVELDGASPSRPAHVRVTLEQAEGLADSACAAKVEQQAEWPE
jgi:hypothetical protein